MLDIFLQFVNIWEAPNFITVAHGCMLGQQRQSAHQGFQFKSLNNSTSFLRPTHLICLTDYMPLSCCNTLHTWQIETLTQRHCCFLYLQQTCSHRKKT